MRASPISPWRAGARLITARTSQSTDSQLLRPAVATDYERHSAVPSNLDYRRRGCSLGEVAERLGYTRASVETLVRDYRQGRLGELFVAPRPGPKRQPKKDAARELVIELRR